MSKLVAGMVALCAIAGTAFADAKVSAASSNTIIGASNSVPPTQNNGVSYQTPWITVSSTQITPPGGKDLFITLSAVTGLETVSDLATFPDNLSEGSVYSAGYSNLQVRILVDGVLASPGSVTFDNTFQIAQAGLANPIQNCKEIDPSGVVQCNFGQAFLDQLNSTGSAHSFSFVMKNVSPQTHVITAQIQFSLSNFVFPVQTSLGFAYGFIGPRTLTVEHYGKSGVMLRAAAATGFWRRRGRPGAGP